MNLSAAIIAGGHSRRMGRDKALLPTREHGTLLARQLDLLATLAPHEILLSCRPNQVLPAPDFVRRIHDDGSHGPLAGVASLLTAARGDLILVLAVDLGGMTAEVLSRLVAAATVFPHVGVVPRTSSGPEPLAAIYPTTLAAEASRRLATGEDLSLHGFIRSGIETRQLRWFDIAPADEPLFANWNTPADLPFKDVTS
jgi:molybdopterin-guanine dinucleotide biosynthesis protein A